MSLSFGSRKASTRLCLSLLPWLFRVRAQSSLFFLRYQQLEEASASLRERIRHLDDMVHCQQKKVKQMVEEVSSHRSLGPGTASCGGEEIAL